MKNPQMDPIEPHGRSILARQWVVRVAVAVSVLLVVAMMAIIWQHWANVREPNTAIQINGDPSLDGTRITVQSEDSSQSPVEVTLNEENKFHERILRLPGRYRVIEHLPVRNQAPFQDVTIYRLHGVVIDLPTTLTINGQPGDKITITNAETGQVEAITFDSHKTQDTLLSLPGKYVLQRTRGAAPVGPPEEFTIQPHVPRKIDLPRID